VFVTSYLPMAPAWVIGDSTPTSLITFCTSGLSSPAAHLPDTCVFVLMRAVKFVARVCGRLRDMPLGAGGRR